MTIDRDQAVRVALRLLDADGLDRLTLRRIATELNVQAPALYWHFQHKRALLDHLTDVMLAREVRKLGKPKPGVEWWEWITEAAHALRRGLLAHTDGARVASGADLTRAVALGTLLDRTIGVLHDAGFELRDAARAASGLLWFVVGRAVEEQSQPDPESVQIVLQGKAFPNFTAAIRAGFGGSGTAEETFAYSLGIMVSGLRSVAP